MEINYQQLIFEGLKELPPEALVEVATFITLLKKRFSDPTRYFNELEKFLRSKERSNLPRSRKYKDGKDALLKFIGGVSQGSLAQNIDEELYGK